MFILFLISLVDTVNAICSLDEELICSLDGKFIISLFLSQRDND